MINGGKVVVPCLVSMALIAAVIPAAGGWFKPAVVPDPKTGLPSQIVCRDVRAGNLLVAPVSLVLREDVKDKSVPALAPAGAKTWALDWTERDLKVEVKYGSEKTAFIEVSLTNRSDKERSLSCTLKLPLSPGADHAFFPAGEKPLVAVVQESKPLIYGYQSSGTQTAMPLGQVYDTKDDWGLAFFSESGELIEPLSATLSHTAKETLAAITLGGLSCKAKGTASQRLYLAATRGDWRPALGAVLAQFPQAFEPHNPDIAPLHGPFVCSGGTPPNKDIEDWYSQGCRVVEIHGTAPWYGEYVPKKEPWTPFCDDQWHYLKASIPASQRPSDDASWQDLRAFVEKKNPPTMTMASVSDYIDRLHQHGMKGLIYFNPTEAWAPWAASEFPGDRNMAPNGKPYPAWYESSSMIPDKNRPWGKYLLDQIQGQLRIYPKVDGVFFDQSAGGGHDLTELCAEGCRIVRAQGKICWWNGPYNMELAALADGMMTEGGGTETYRSSTEIIQYYGIAGKPIISLGPANTAAWSEMLIHGVIPQPVGKSEREISERWSPLFRWLRNRRWVLEPHALDFPPGINANLYRVPDGNYVLPMVRDPVVGDNAKSVFNVPITVRVQDVRQVRGVYLLAPDLMGYHKLSFTRRGNEARIIVPRLGPAGLIVLAKIGTFVALEGAMHLVRGTTSNVRWVFDDWTDAGAKPLSFPASPLQSDASRATVTLSTQVSGKEVAGRAELWIDPPVLLSAEAPPQARDDESFALKVQLLSHLPSKTPVRVEAASTACRVESAKATLTPETATSLELKARPFSAGETTIHVTATAGEVSRDTTIPMEVLATALGPGGFEKIRSADLVLDEFGVDGGMYAHKPISINGVEIGDVPVGSGDTWINDKVAPLTTAAIKSLREENQISIDNKVGDAFKVRNLRLLLRLRGGITVVSSVDRGVYTGWTNWLYGEGKQFPSGQPLTGITVKVTVDANRKDKYEEFFGELKSGRLVLEINGSDSGPYAHKPVSINNRIIGDLPAAGDWTEKSMALTTEALDGLMKRNEVVIENSNPPDAFKVRRARIEIKNTDGKKFVTDTEQGAYTSVGWEFQEGIVGSPIRFALRFRRQ